MYCTEPDKDKRLELQKSVEGTALYEQFGLHTERADFPELIYSEMADRIVKDKLSGGETMPSSSSTLVTFCGGTVFASHINAAVQDANAAGKLVQGDSNHVMYFAHENYGISTPASKKKTRA